MALRRLNVFRGGVLNVRGTSQSAHDLKEVTTTKSDKQDNINTNFDDPVTAFKSKTTSELMRAYWVYQLTSFRTLVDNNTYLLNLTRRILGKNMYRWVMRRSIYGHFVGGETEVEVLPLMKRMDAFGVRTILDYSVEEDISHEAAEKLEDSALKDTHTVLPQYKVNLKHLDRREKVVAARTFFYENESTCDKNMEVFLKSIETLAKSKYPGMVAIKLTALCRPKLLLVISEVITRSRTYVSEMNAGSVAGPMIKQGVRKERFFEEVQNSQKQVKDRSGSEQFLKNVTADQEGIINLFPWSGILNDEFEASQVFKVPDSKTGEMVNFLSQLTPEEEHQLHNMVRRFNAVVKAGAELDVPVMVDAEQTYFQPAISRLTVEMMRKYNTTKGVVYNTYQNYLKDSYDEVVSDLEQARRQNFFFRCKLVRGAYLEQERMRAQEMNYPDPCQPNYEATSENYHRIMAACFRIMKELKDKGVTERNIKVMVATHNEETIRLAIDQMKEIGIAPEEGSVQFGQLLGMCDFISYPLGDAGYHIYKYVPYGPVDKLMPYLSRRLTENRGVLRNVVKEKKLLGREIVRRLKKKDMNKDPMKKKGEMEVA